jgi:hypothetical protein
MSSLVSTAKRRGTAMRVATDPARARPARVSGHRPRSSVRCASVREFPQNSRALDPRGRWLDRRARRSARLGVGRRYVGRAPTACGHRHRPAGRDRLRPAVPRAARTSPRARQPPSQRQPGGPRANRHGANHTARRETGPAHRRPPQLQAQTHEHPGAAVRHPPPGRPVPRWPAAAQSAAACVVHHRSLHRTQPSLHRTRPGKRRRPPPASTTANAIPSPSTARVKNPFDSRRRRGGWRSPRARCFGL